MDEFGELLALPVVSEAVRKLGSAIEGDETMRRRNLTNALEKMRMSLRTIWGFREEAERWSEREMAVRVWLRRLKDLAYEISDAVDDNYAEEKLAPGTLRRMTPCLAILYSKITKPQKINCLLEELSELLEQYPRFQLISDIACPGIDLKETTSRVSETKIVGRDGEMQCIIDELLSAAATRQGPIILPIFGVGGIGKTTLAQLIFNHQHFRDYSRAWVYVSRDFDVYKIGLSIISQLTGNESLVSTDTMKQLISSHLQGIARRDMLVVLDDLWEDDPSELERLNELISSVGEDNKVIVIITTRSKNIARKICTLQPFRLNLLGDDLCWEIIQEKSYFEDRDDKQELEQIRRRIAIKCGGLPLAATEFGYILRSRNASDWSEIMDTDAWNIEDNPGLSMVTSSLDLSVMSMPRRLRSCFTYLAIFPKGHHILKHDLIHQWIAAGHVVEPPAGHTLSTTELAEKYIERLLDISFPQNSTSSLTSEKNGKNVILFNIHDLLHEVARLVMGYDFITLDGRVEIYYQKNNCRYALLTNFEDIQPVNLSSILPAQLRALRFLGCNKMVLSEDAFAFTKHLRVLDLSECSVKKLPDSIGQLKLLGYLNAPRIEDAVFPIVITQLSKLSYLGLHGSRKISKLSESIDRLKYVMYLDLSGCSRLETLPRSFGSLKSLMHLDLSGCSGLETLPRSFGSLKSLKHLDLSGCSGLETLPKSFGSLKSLKHLDLSGCSGLETLPRSFGSLKSLKHLDLSGCSGLETLPRSFGSLKNLKHLDLSGCSGLETLSRSFGSLKSLKHLDLSGCSGLETLSRSFGSLKSLKHLDLSGCSGLETLSRSFGSLKSLKHLDLSGCSGLETLPRSFGSLKSLMHLDLSGCSGLETLPRLFGSLKSLKHLDLSGCCGLETLPRSFGSLKSLMHLDLSGCSGLATLPRSFGSLKSLMHLDLSGCSGLETLPRLFGSLKSLKHLDLSGCCGLETLPRSFGSLKSLKHLDLSGCSRLETLLESFGNLKCLMYLHLSGCSGLETLLESFGNLIFLMHLDLSGCSKLKALPESFVSLKNLVHLDLSECSCLQGVIDALSNFSKLRYLNLSHPCGYFVEDLFHFSGLNEVLPKLKELQYLSLSMCLNPLCFTLAPEVSSKYVGDCITGLGKLEHLDLSHSNFLSELPAESLDSLKELRTLVLSGCFRLKSLPKCIAKLEKLSKIEFSGCPHLESSLPNSIDELRHVLLQNDENAASHVEEIE